MGLPVASAYLCIWIITGIGNHLDLSLRYAVGQTELQPEWVSINEAARLAGIGRSSVYKLIKCGRLTATHVGKRHLVFRESIRFISDEHKTKQNDN